MRPYRILTRACQELNGWRSEHSVALVSILRIPSSWRAARGKTPPVLSRELKEEAARIKQLLFGSARHINLSVSLNFALLERKLNRLLWPELARRVFLCHHLDHLSPLLMVRVHVRFTLKPLN